MQHQSSPLNYLDLVEADGVAAVAEHGHGAAVDVGCDDHGDYYDRDGVGLVVVLGMMRMELMVLLVRLPVLPVRLPYQLSVP